MPLVSIIIPLHNKGPYIAETLASVRAQTIADWEAIVIENGSRDEGPEVVRAIASEDARIRMIEAPPTSTGPGYARNRGLDEATGDWVLFLDADDLIESDYLGTMLGSLGPDPAPDIVAGGWKEFPNGEIRTMTIHHPAAFGLPRDELLPRAAALAPWILHAAIVKRSHLNGEKRWPEELDDVADEDTAFWFSALIGATVHWVRAYGARYRRFPIDSRSSMGDPASRTAGYRRIIERNLDRAASAGVNLAPSVFGHLSTMFEVSYRKAVAAGDQAAASTALLLAAKYLRLCPALSWNIRIRKWIGIANVNRLRRIFRPS